jgi:CheY-like chemotaxis protein
VRPGENSEPGCGELFV